MSVSKVYIRTRDVEPAGGAQKRPRSAAGSESRTGDLRKLVAAVRTLVPQIAARAAKLDHLADFPSEDIACLHEAGALAAPLDPAYGGIGLGRGPDGARALAGVLRLFGRASLPLGRLYEGHVNALALISKFGGAAFNRKAATIAASGNLLAVWNTESPSAGLRLAASGGKLSLEGGKTFASGAGHIRHALVTVREENRPQLVLVHIADPERRAGFEAWRTSGMRASSTAAVDLTGIEVAPEDLLGQPGDYERQPEFSGEAWRVLAAQTGGMEALTHHLRQGVSRAPHRDFPLQRARLARAVAYCLTARLWVERSAEIASDEARTADEIVAAVNLARGVIEESAMSVIAIAQQGLGTRAFFEDGPVDRVCRDLAFYLRQPAPDLALDDAAKHFMDRPADLGGDWP